MRLAEAAIRRQLLLRVAGSNSDVCSQVAS
jgi:hypothetical protein